MGHREYLGDRVKCWMGKSLKTEIENEENPKNWIPTRSANFGEIQNSKTELGESPRISKNIYIYMKQCIIEKETWENK